MRSLFSATGLLVRRRLRRNAGLLAAWTGLLAIATVLALAIPGIILSTVDRGAREAVAAAGTAADILVLADVNEQNYSGQYISIKNLLALVDNLVLPPEIARVTGERSLTVVAPPVSLFTDDGAIASRLVLLTQSHRLTVVDGELPRTADQVAVTVAGAELKGLKVGSPLGALVVSGIVEPGDDECWCDLPGVWDVDEPLTMFATAEGIAPFQPLEATIRLSIRPEAFSSARIAEVERSIRSLQLNTYRLSGGTATLLVQTQFGDALEDFPRGERAALAQLSLLTAGPLGVLAAVLVLLSRLIVERRASDLLLERARGSSLAAIGVRALAESALTALVGCGLGVAIALPFLVAVTPVIPVFVIALLAGPVQAVLFARGASRSTRQPANRADRHDAVQRARVRRIVAELAVVALAAGAIVSVRSRGLLQTTTEGIDPLLAATPLLLSTVVTLALMRLYPLVIRGLSALAQRSRGALGVLGASQARHSLAPLPLFALTLAMALAVGSGLLVDTVRSGQVDASWQRVGADARVTGVLSEEDVAAVASAPGVTFSSRSVASSSVELGGLRSIVLVTAIAVDEGYPDVAEELPGPAPAASLRQLASSNEPLPMVVDPELADRIGAEEITLRFGQDEVAVEVVGVQSRGPSGYLSGRFVYVDLDSLNERLKSDLKPDTLLVMGPGTDAAVGDFGDVLTRSGWLAERRDSALAGGVTTVIALTAAAAGALALIALLSTVLATSRRRATTLALLRTLGITPRFGWWLALAEIAPVVVAAVVGGALAGVGIILALGSSLGLAVLTGGVGQPTLLISPLVLVGLAAAALLILVLAMLAEVLVRRRDRLSDVLRVGGTE
ncbi:hypothetical protein EYE40_13360 [Glaciihabitans arcticus]|uniref:FtsX-like permease family protein n=1 Tax=Glaciihabitans arcticus TaxID=2668039 RepID=A0A4Q9GU81_9MICO|nr:FtsX-like permease family protein [Glaciihabitans arcticus]TBN58301.1 hypothetical protein EYE40_13360 [Glaciihabitans arcticus]